MNFLPGFIQRPEVYLEGLSQTALRPRHYPQKPGAGFYAQRRQPRRHASQVRVCDYCRSKGHAVALDDVESPLAAQAMVQDIRPDYVKLDIKLVLRASKGAAGGQDQEAIRNIVQHCHAQGAMVLAEGVETEESYAFLKSAEVDLFQGYLFSPPVPVEEIRKGDGRMTQNFISHPVILIPPQRTASPSAHGALAPRR